MEILNIDSRTWRIEDGGVRFFLLAGDMRALLVDCGMIVRNARDIAEGRTRSRHPHLHGAKAP